MEKAQRFKMTVDFMPNRKKFILELNGDPLRPDYVLPSNAPIANTFRGAYINGTIDGRYMGFGETGLTYTPCSKDASK